MAGVQLPSLYLLQKVFHAQVSPQPLHEVYISSDIEVWHKVYISIHCFTDKVWNKLIFIPRTFIWSNSLVYSDLVLITKDEALCALRLGAPEQLTAQIS